MSGFNVGSITKEKYQKAVKNTKAKIKRIQKKYGVNLNDEIKIPSLESFGSRKEFNAWLRENESFRNRANQSYQYVKNEYGVVASKKELFDIDKSVKQAQRLARKKIAESHELPFVSGGKLQGTVGMQRPQKSGVTVMKDFSFKDVRSIGRLKEIRENSQRRVDEEYYRWRKQIMYDNFIQYLEMTLHSDADELLRELESVHPEDFYELYLMYDEFDFTLYYNDGDYSGEFSGEVQQMLAYVRAFKQGQLPLKMKHKNFE